VGLTVEDAERSRAWADFQSTTSFTYEVIRDESTLALETLSAVRAFWTAHPQSSAADFERFVEALGNLQGSGSIRAIALLPRVTRTGRAAFLSHISAEAETRAALGYPPFRIWPESQAEESFPAVYVEPRRERGSVLGYDLATNAERKVAMLRSAGEGRTISSAPIHLTQDDKGYRSSVLLLAPLYELPSSARDGARAWWHAWPATLDADKVNVSPLRASHVGFVGMGYSPSMGLADKVDRVVSNGLSVAVWDGGSVTDVLAGPFPQRPPPKGDLSLFHASGPAFADGTGAVCLDLVRRLNFAGRVWWVGFCGLEAFRPWTSKALPLGMAGAVLFGALCLAALSQHLMAQRASLEEGVAQRTNELVRANTALRASQSRAEAASAAKTQFLSAMSHELRTPLNAIIGFAQMLQEGIGLGDSPESRVQTMRTYAGYILAAGESLLAQIGRVLDMSRIEAGRLSLKPQPVDIASIARDRVAMMRPVATAQSVRLTCTSPPDMPLAYADLQAVRQILENLLSNAIKFSRPEGTVAVSVSLVPIDAANTQVAAMAACDSMARLSVSDDGVGIPPDQIDKVTDPFHQVADQMTRGHPGLGLGLAIVRDLVEGQQGHLFIDSRLGKGTAVTVLLPLAVTVPETVSQSGGNDGAVSGEGGTANASNDPTARHTDFARQS